ncbi:unnamed protein product, partial [Mesorhabditis spiculigera]
MPGPFCFTALSYSQLELVVGYLQPDERIKLLKTSKDNRTLVRDKGLIPNRIKEWRLVAGNCSQKRRDGELRVFSREIRMTIVPEESPGVHLTRGEVLVRK